MSAVLGTKKCKQICVIVKDVEKAKIKWAEFFGMPVPPTTNGGPYFITQAVYKGAPEPVANCLMGAFTLSEEMQFETLQPVGGVPSEWQNFLDEHGEGLHHFAFGVKDTEEVLSSAKAAGFACTQKGNYNDGHGMYAYLDTHPALKATVETLETFYPDN